MRRCVTQSMLHSLSHSAARPSCLGLSAYQHGRQCSTLGVHAKLAMGSSRDVIRRSGL